jgi:hypothetical protein
MVLRMDQRMVSDCDCGPFYLLTLTCRLSGWDAAREVLCGLELQKNVSDPPLYRRETEPGLFHSGLGTWLGWRKQKYLYSIGTKFVGRLLFRMPR